MDEWLVELDHDESGLVVGSNDSGVEPDATFLALVAPEPHAEGRIDRTLRRGSEQIAAITQYRKIESFGLAALVELEPDLPRMHQVREHIQSIGLSIVGDRRFRGDEFIKIPHFPGRLWLHLARLTLAGSTFTSPLPVELTDHLETLRPRGR